MPKEQERTELLEALCEKVELATDVDIAYIAKRTAVSIKSVRANLNALSELVTEIVL